MSAIEAVKYGFVGLAALFGFWAAVKVKARGPGGERGMRLINGFMVLAIALLTLSGVLAFYEGYYLRRDARLTQTSQIISRMDQTIGDKLGLDNDAFAGMDAYSKQIVDNIIRQLCRDVIDLSELTSRAEAPRCRARLSNPPLEAPT